MLLYCTTHTKNNNSKTFHSISNLSFQSKQQDIRLLYRINQLLIERSLLQPSQTILIAVSGGQDSICLLNILYRLHPKWNWKLAIAHCDHKWHSSSLSQAKEVSRLAANMQINYYQTVTTHPVDTEQLARIWRYEVLRRIAMLHNYQIIVTGHSASDRVETLIHNLIRGSGFNGLQSLSWKRRLNTNLTVSKQLTKKRLLSYSKPVIFLWHLTQIKPKQKIIDLCLVRPLLNIARIELKRIIQQWKLPVWSDPTNRMLQIRRNRIRNQLLPYLRKYFNPKIDYVLTSLTEVVHAEFLYLDTVTDCVCSKNKSHVAQNSSLKNYAQLDIQLLRALPLAIQRRILKRFLDCYTDTFISFEHVEQVRIFIVINADFLNKTDEHKRNLQKPMKIQRSICLPSKVSLWIINQRIVLLHNQNRIKIAM